ncbi:peptidylprolyl isomerase [Pseudonocardia phyllosphaerae]|uniref:peptidylprolyl isomerase n=1 Tax=Pseudonocardia phyllosphaerae TaxID=3390502 RepID=UPI00397A0000
MATNQQRREAAKRKLEAQQKHRAEREARRKKVTAIASIATVVVVVIAVVAVFLLRDAWSGPDESQAAAPPDATPTAGTCTYSPGEAAAKPVQPPADGPAQTTGTAKVALSTSAGPIDLTLDRAKAPCAVNSFLNLTKQKYFDGTSCHRLTTTPGLQVLQCGDPTGQGTGGPGYSFADEVAPDQKYQRGVLAMANAGPNTNGSQFFMIYGDAQLPPQYTVFGTIGAAGLKTVDGVAKAGVAGGGQDGTPAKPVKITTAAAS